jgi:ABC-type bacteriocin/lantibiotic exporter with double-glycine peptidase domain
VAYDAHAHEHSDHDHHEHEHLSPSRRLWRMLMLDRKDLTVVVLYTVMTGLLALAVPLASQALVNTIAQGQFLQQLVVLAAAVLFFLLFAAILQLLELSLVETLQQRIFARISLKLAERVPRIRQDALASEYAPELVNRFFDVLTIQKAFAKLTLDGLAAVLKVFVGLALLAFYSPILLGFDVFIILFAAFVIWILGIGGLQTSIQESKQKYKVAAWLEELARCHISFKMSGAGEFFRDRMDDLVVGYITARRSHFRIIFRQAVGNYIFYAIASAGVLAIGGALVIDRQLTLGQLVAAEIIVVTVLASLDKVIQQLEHVYDLLTGLDKVGHLEDMPLEREIGGVMPPPPGGGVTVNCRGVRFSYAPGREILSGVEFSLRPGERVSLVGASGAGKSTLAALMCGLLEPGHGTVEINGLDVRDADLNGLRQVVGMVCDREEVFDGTIEENLTMGTSWVTREDVRWALEVTQLANEIASLPDGLQTELVSGGRNLSRGQVQRLLLARAIVRRPKLLILDEAFTGVDERTKLAILDTLYAREHAWTIIDISHDSEVVVRSSIVHVLADGKIVESGSPEELSWRRNSAFGQLFPEVARQVLGKRLTSKA